MKPAIRKLTYHGNGMKVELRESKDNHGTYYAIDVYPHGLPNERLRVFKMYKVLPNAYQIANEAYTQWYLDYMKQLEDKNENQDIE